MSKLFKIVLIVGGILVLAGGGYYFVTNQNKTNTNNGLFSSNPLAQTQTKPSTDVSTQTADQFVQMLASATSVKLDMSLFKSPSFQALQDFSVILVGEPLGRPNPFAQVGQDAPLPTTNVFSVTTNEVVLLTDTAANLQGQVSQGTIADERWFEWGTTNTPPLANITPKITQSISTGVFTFQLTGLTPKTTYYVRAATRLGQTTVYGAVVTFKTKETPKPPTQ